ncbi:hypothetical protein A2230_07270 [candidate division WOR-1 bacterium RIFOXYA2_FULL_36_21]|uniref:PurE domain-containing protein n=1 Tax=candidate division WOR-1 bacterium RIFOXYB2_FULL_36_35 TaxID=1802578 RepID=A0A1F4RX63_UNCSA|nr:MAG: hypothetical protein A2230_07270 [candidate division WOR-1 bacterium RIFOXYA2_FULL_36_21]OGC12765.1 MAG: hypothetical protein A2290_01100 [candidate division WOR-1 bacterium RIFOXYB2_FULL_36_35]OGC19800.1 MAG: hypothetical protein A2282_01020 [candidate division WOR-1 bacterium RIFOXYA12_FULL_36_13]
MNIKNTLKKLKADKISINEACDLLKTDSYEDLDFAKIDHHRIKRKGFPEVIFCEGKTSAQISKIAKAIYKRGDNILATRADTKAYKAIKKAVKKAKYYKEARIVEYRKRDKVSRFQGIEVVVVTAGTSDIPIAEEAVVTLKFLGHEVGKLYDVGVAGLHRLTKNLEKLQEASVLIVVAGMEGALPSVIGGLVDGPVIAVPTSIGYGANFKGLSALLTMLNSCAPGVAAVNIDNGFGAAVMADSILKAKNKHMKNIETEKDKVYLLETNIDDMNPNLYDHTINKLMKFGALDAFFEPVRMKKKRAAVKLSVLSPINLKDKLLKIIFEETTTFGIREQLIEREKLSRCFKTIKTKYGKVSFKIGKLGRKIVTLAPEYEDYKKLANKHRIPIEKVYKELFNPDYHNLG